MQRSFEEQVGGVTEMPDDQSIVLVPWEDDSAQSSSQWDDPVRGLRDKVRGGPVEILEMTPGRREALAKYAWGPTDRLASPEEEESWTTTY